MAIEIAQKPTIVVKRAPVREWTTGLAPPPYAELTIVIRAEQEDMGDVAALLELLGWKDKPVGYPDAAPEFDPCR